MYNIFDQYDELWEKHKKAKALIEGFVEEIKQLKASIDKFEKKELNNE